MKKAEFFLKWSVVLFFFFFSICELDVSQVGFAFAMDDGVW